MSTAASASTAPTNARSGPQLRRWQHGALERMESWEHGAFLIAAAPGAGKTRPALEYARRMLQRHEIDQVVLVCPTSPLTRQWASAANALGINLVPDAAPERLPRGFHGVAVTYARVAMAPADWARHTTYRTLVIADEAHHLGDELAWGQNFAAAFGHATRWMLLSGTPFRSDTSAIPGVRYDSDGVAQPDYSYSYAEAVKDGVCRPVTFIPFDGEMSWSDGEDTTTASFSDIVTSDQRAKRYRTAISTELAGALPKILREAHKRLYDLRTGNGQPAHPGAGGLVVAADSEHAKRIASVLHEISGIKPVVVLHTDPAAHRRLREFTDSSAPWIVAVNMVSEGVDIPRLRVGVYATAAKTPMIFRQIVGRFVRMLPDRPQEASWLYLPGEATLRAHATEIDRELVPFLRRKDEAESDFLQDEFDRPEKTESEALPSEFKALNAEMNAAAQLDLFGGMKVLAAEETVGQAAAQQPDEVPVPTQVVETPLWEQRQKLRNERHQLVAELGRQRRAGHKEINAWLNREVGVVNVGDATLEQLERSIEVLHLALSGRI